MDYPDKLGCYRVGNLKFYSKLEAIEAQLRTGTHLHWDFNEAVFSSYDWTVEPTDDILDLYKKRAQQLRAKYDYIVLWWSGGADSTTVLQSFLLNDIKIDEIVTYSNYEASGDRTDFLNAEVFEVVIPTVEQLKSQYPWLKHRVVDISKHTLDVFLDKDLRFDWLYTMNMFFTPNHIARDGIVFKIKEWRDLVDQGQKFCVLWGHDKPRICHENGRFFFRFIDIIDNGPNVKSFAGLLPYTDELFYWTPDMPEILIKQSHLIKNYMNRNLLTSPYISDHKSDLAYKMHNDKMLWLSVDGVHSVIYPNWSLNTFTVGKPASIITSPRDAWFFNSEHNNASKRIWRMGVNKLFDFLPDYWKNDPDDMTKGLKGCVSKRYYLER